ncbi:hypothetical protein [Methylorubrum extorquens]
MTAMTRFTLGVSIWTAGAVLLLYVTIVLIDRVGSGRRFFGVVCEDNWYVTLPGLALTFVGYRIMSRARL